MSRTLHKTPKVWHYDLRMLGFFPNSPCCCVSRHRNEGGIRVYLIFPVGSVITMLCRDLLYGGTRIG